MSFLLAMALYSSQGTVTHSGIIEFSSSFASKVGTINVGSALPGPVMAFGSDAYIVATAKSGKSSRPFLAAATHGKGRAMAIGHGGLLGATGNEVFAQIILTWLHRSKKPIGLFENMIVNPAFGTPLRFRGNGDLASAIQQCGTLVIGQSTVDNNPAAIESLDKFVLEGGGLIVCGPAWGWLQLNPGKQLATDQSGQLLLARMGLGFTDGTIDPVKGQFELLPASSAHHLGRILESIESRRIIQPASDVKIFAQTLESALSGLAPNSPILKQIDQLLVTDQSSIRPTKKDPISSEQFQFRLAAQYFDKSWRTLAPDQVKAHPSSEDFPGPVTTKDREDMTVKVGGKMRRWWSTGAYAAPGEVITVRLPAELQGLGIRLRIGGHNDTLWGLDKWERFPSIALEVPIKDGVGKAASPFGGLVYLVCHQSVPNASVEIEHVIASPTYFLGKTSDSNWKKLQNSPAPWGEIVSNNCVVCVPSSVLKTLANPKEVAEYWDEVIQQVELLYSVPAGTREERYQVDRQISAGYMHSGYPIMTWEDVSAKFVDTKILRGNSGDTNWGFYHEVGHNFQRPSWTWDGWGETTNNLYSLFGCEHFNRDLTGGHGAMQPDQRTKRMKEVADAPGKEEYFHKDPWYGLTFLRTIREEFGWEPFEKLFAEFRDLPRDQQPRGEQEKQDQFMVRMSKLIRRDLSLYFEMWGVKNTDDAKQKAKVFPAWLPKGM